MSREVITFRPTDEVADALKLLTEDSGNRTEAISAAIIAAARGRRQEMQREEVARLASDPNDQAAIREVMEDMESIRAW